MTCRALAVLLLAIVGAVASEHAVPTSVQTTTVPNTVQTAKPKPGAVLRWDGSIQFPLSDFTIYAADVDDLWRRVKEYSPAIEWSPMQIIYNFALELLQDWYEANFPEKNRQTRDLRACAADSGIATGNSTEARRILDRLRTIKGRWAIGPQRCHRIGCGNNTGVYWCNDNKSAIRTSANALYTRASRILETCCHLSNDKGAFRYSGDPISGVEAFPSNHSEAAHSRVVVGYGNCSDTASIDPLVYTFPGTLGRCRAYKDGLDHWERGPPQAEEVRTGFWVGLISRWWPALHCVSVGIINYALIRWPFHAVQYLVNTFIFINLCWYTWHMCLIQSMEIPYSSPLGLIIGAVLPVLIQRYFSPQLGQR